MWALGDYPPSPTELIADLGPVLVEAVRRRARRTASSTSPPAPATPRSRPPGSARDVVASDLTPELLETAGQAAARAPRRSTWQEADAEALPYADGDVRRRACPASA